MNPRFIVVFLITHFILLSGIFSQSKDGRLYSELANSSHGDRQFPTYQLFKPESDAAAKPLIASYNKANYWRQDARVYQQLHEFNLPLISLKISDYQQNIFTVLLEKQELFGTESRLITSGSPGKSEKLEPGLYYRGTIKEFPGSIAAFSFFEDQTIAVMSLPGKGNLVFGKMNSANETESDLPHVLYYENELPQKSGFECGTSDLISDGLQIQSRFNAPDSIFSSRCKTVKIFLECDYKLYQDYNRQVTQVKNYITGLFNVVKTLYYNEYVNIEISDIMVWTTQDPFLHTTLSDIIYNYAGYRRNNFTGNLAQLVTTQAPQQQGGIAFLGTLCQQYNASNGSGPHSFAYIYNSYNQLPSYSWSVEVMTHELGHNLGSPHTHACFWGPNRDMTLDNCQAPENNACAAGPPATGGGTIMSYCHLTGFGINFSKGFGKEPGDLIRINVANRTCISYSYTATIESNFNGPYYEGDNIILKARPSKSEYSFDWFHYDYLLPIPKDSILRPTYSGIYKSAVSSHSCTEYSQPDTVEISDFLVNLGCPVNPGFRDSVVVSLTMNADQNTNRETLTVPDSLYLKVPLLVKDVLVELHTRITPMGNSWTRDVITAYQGPVETGISNSRYTPNSSEPILFNGEKTYVKILGKFNPKGDWYFTTNDIKFDNGIDAKVTYSIVISWRKQDTVTSCDIALCDGNSKTFDAGITGGRYVWSTGATTKTITTNQPGSLSLEVTKGSKKSTHTVNLFVYNTHYNQSHLICEGDTVTIGKRHYTKSGTYVDTLISFTGCDSIITSTIDVTPTSVSNENVSLCYGEMWDSVAFFNDTQLVNHHVAANGCDSLHFINIHVNPQIVIQSNAIPACPEIGGSLEAIVTGGSGNSYHYEWSNGQVTKKIDNVKNGIYNLKVIDSLGCIQVKEIEFQNLDSIGILPLVFDVSCFGKEDGKIFIDFSSGPSPFTINWSNGASTKDIHDLKSGKYTLFVRDANGCTISKDIEVRSPELLDIQLNIKGSTGSDGSAIAHIKGGTHPYAYLWSTGESTNEITNLKPGDYWLIVRDQNGCESRYDFSVPEIVGTDDTDFKFPLKLYPVPVKNELKILFGSANSNQERFSIKIIDIHSRIWKTQTVGNNTLHTINVSQLPSGVYILELRTPENNVLRKMFVKD